MSDAVLRCPNCGTTQAVAGECETCHEAQVRWFCPNHTPGRWLDGPVCAECAARPKREAPRPTRPRPTAPPPRDVSRGAPPPEPPVRDPGRELLEALLGGRRREPVEPDLAEEEWRVEPPVSRRRGTPVPWGREERPEVRMPRIPFLGCVGQLVKLAVILLILLALGTCWFFSGSGISIGENETVPGSGVSASAASAASAATGIVLDSGHTLGADRFTLRAQR